MNAPSEQAAPTRRELAGALHEVSNALTGVLGWVELAQEQLRGIQQAIRSGSSSSAQAAAGKLAEALRVAEGRARVGHQLARRAIGADVSVVEGDCLAFEVAQDVLLGVQPQAQRAQVELTLDAVQGQALTVSEGLAIGQILTNLVLNAVAFSPPGGEVTLRVEASEDQVLFAVLDQGPGVDPGRAEELFDAPQSTRDGGAGVGLPHSHSLAESKGGLLALAPGAEGACFELRWPQAEVRSAARAKTGGREFLSGKNVLVVEDDAAVVSLLELALEARGARLVHARSAAELSGALEGAPYDAVLLDLSPLEDNVSEALERLALNSPGAPIVVISGAADALPPAASDRIAAWVRKPFEVSELVETLSRFA